MPVIAVIGAQWGDEGKGKIIDMLAEKASIVVRFSGGDNAGHTVINSFGEFKLHIMPSGIFYPHTTCIIGNGTVINPAVLLEEITNLKQHVNFERFFISDRAHVIMPYHILLDKLDEEKRGGKAIGTTLKGIGPAFTDKVSRLGIRMGELLDNKNFEEHLRLVLEGKNEIFTRLYGTKPLSFEDIYKQYCEYGAQLSPFIRDTTVLIAEALNKNEVIMMEGAQGALLDPDFGTYPFTTSSSPLAGNASLGAGIGPTSISVVLGVFKAYCTRVGSGPMPTELKDDIGYQIRQRGHEFGATTGRPRRCGWFDGVAAAYSSRLNGYTKMAITRLDILDDFPVLKVCTAYKVKGQIIQNFPGSIAILEKCEPVYEELEGWMSPTSDIRQYDQLPLQARCYLERLEEICSCPASIISVGPRREQTVIKSPLI